MAYQEVTRTGIIGRLGGAFKGVLTGLVIFVLAFPLLFWNESRAVKRARTLDEGQGIVQATLPDSVDSALNGQLVHMTGLASTTDVLQDDAFGIGTNAIKLTRVVEMYQWKETSRSETKTQTGGTEETVTTYDYEQTWSPSTISDSNFKVPAGHSNPASMPFTGGDWLAQNVALGAFQLPTSLSGKISGSQALSLNEADLTKISQTANVPIEQTGEWVYLNYAGSSAAPQIGDVRVKFSFVPESTVSIVSQQDGNSFKAYQSKHGSAINMLSMGVKTPDEMFEAAKQANTAMTWGLRVLGYFMMAGGLAAVFGPLVVLASVLPFLGNLLGAGARLIAGVIAFFFTFITIAIAWLVVRPVLGFSLIAIAVIVLVAGLMLSRQKATKTQADVAAAAA